MYLSHICVSLSLPLSLKSIKNILLSEDFKKKRNFLGLWWPLVSLSHNSGWFLQAEVRGTSLPSTGTLGWVALCGAGTPCSSEGTCAVEISLPIFIYHMWIQGQSVLVSLPFLPVSMWLLYILSCRTCIELRWL